MNRASITSPPSSADYFLVLLLVNLSGNMAFLTGVRQDFFLLAALTFAFLRMALIGRALTRIFVVVLTSYLVLFTFQTISLNYFAPVTIAGFLTRLVFAAAVVSTVRSFRFVYVRVMVWLTILSFIFHVPTLLGAILGVKVYEIFRPVANIVGADSNSVNERMNILLHNFQVDVGLFRNAGVFWEPGAFSGYLVLALVFLATLRGTLFEEKLRRWRAVLVLGILSTLSTTGFLALPFVLFTFRLVTPENQKNFSRRFLRFLSFILLLFLIGIPFWNLNFVGPKIVSLYDRAVNQAPGWHTSRFGAVIFDMPYIQQKPLFGWGQNDATQYQLNPYLERYATGNGLSGHLRQFGLFGLAIFLVSTWIGLGRIGLHSTQRAWVIGILVLQLNGEFFLNYPLYLTLLFIGLERRPPLRHLLGPSVMSKQLKQTNP